MSCTKNKSFGFYDLFIIIIIIFNNLEYLDSLRWFLSRSFFLPLPCLPALLVMKVVNAKFANSWLTTSSLNKVFLRVQSFSTVVITERHVRKITVLYWHKYVCASSGWTVEDAWPALSFVILEGIGCLGTLKLSEWRIDSLRMAFCFCRRLYFVSSSV